MGEPMLEKWLDLLPAYQLELARLRGGKPVRRWDARHEDKREPRKTRKTRKAEEGQHHEEHEGGEKGRLI